MQRGEFPAPVENLAYLLRVKARAGALGFAAVTTYGRELIIKVPNGYRASIGVLNRAAGRSLRQGHTGLVWPDFERDPEWPEKLLSVLDALIRW